MDYDYILKHVGITQQLFIGVKLFIICDVKT